MVPVIVQTTQQCEDYSDVEPDRTLQAHTPLMGRPQSTSSTALVARPAGLTPAFNPAPKPAPPNTPFTQPAGLTPSYNPATKPSTFTPAVKQARTPLVQVDNTPGTPVIGTAVRNHPAKHPLSYHNIPVNAEPRIYETPTTLRSNQHATSSMQMKPIRRRQQEPDDFGGLFRSSLSLAFGEEAENYSYLNDLHADEPREAKTNACANCEVLKREIEALKQNHIPGTSFT